ncbi:histone H2A.Z-specific chaperone CHZ1 [Aspergillus candidus]|uniref:Histone chaperone domain CHZ-domain-containing protein n=1 Tax=Aspergillus candidus TaxID=41067 RepID=A0A2I2FF03_ASPCN|nr:histone chaperone domain CHZ-domain-containing protein [Aspergillus candidus]PLB39195.1 histone chaperone domain CHZ-domain-containing protein [Aspergillus candidus]
MGDNNMGATLGDQPSGNAPGALDKGKGKSVEDPTSHEMSVDEDDSESEPEAEEIVEDEDEDDGGNLEPISSENIISGGRRTRGKTIDFQEAAEKLKADEMSDDDDDDEDFVANDDNDDGNKMRD